MEADTLNKIVSFVLGIVIVLVFFTVVTGKIVFKKMNIKIPEPSCDLYKNGVVSDIPVRCINYYFNK